MDLQREKPQPQGAQQGCHCPFCDSAMEMPYPFCQVCGSKVEYCAVCGEPLPAGAEFCPHCAGEGR